MVFLPSSEGIIPPACSHPLRKGPAGRTATQRGNHICFPRRMDTKGKASHLERVKLQWIPKKGATSQSPGNPAAAPRTPLARCSEGSGTEQSAAWKLRTSRHYPLCQNKRGGLEMRILEQGLLKGKDGEPGEPTSAWARPHPSAPACTGSAARAAGTDYPAAMAGPTSVGWVGAGYGLIHKPDPFPLERYCYRQHLEFAKHRAVNIGQGFLLRLYSSSGTTGKNCRRRTMGYA